VKIFADGADLESMIALADDPRIGGFTTNPTLMRKAGVSDYEAFARKILATIVTQPISFEVFADDNAEMLRQARLIASWGENVYVKIPVTNTAGVSTETVVRELSAEGIHLNVISVFAGRIADTGRDPMPIMRASVALLAHDASLELLWASPREVLNIKQAEEIGVDIITVTHDLLAKMSSFDKDLDQFSLETVQMFHRDALAAGYTL
jgi:transaldolase